MMKKLEGYRGKTVLIILDGEVDQLTREIIQSYKLSS